MNCLVDPRTFLRFDFGAYHPFKTYRLGLAYTLFEALGLLDAESVCILLPRAATDAELLAFHTAPYLEILRLADSGMFVPNLFSHNLGSGDNPVFPGVYEWATGVAGASIDSAKTVLEGRARIAFNPAGGLHHAMPAHAAGFCHINDAALAVSTLALAGKRVAYVDIDAHHGDGVQHAFYKTDQVLTVSVHQDGHTIFPGTGFVGEIGLDAGRGYAVNVPLLPGARDDAFQRVFDDVVFPLIEDFAPEVLVTQLGADALLGDRVAALGMSLRCFESYVARLRALDVPWVALGGGGYDVGNVVRAWALAWARMNDIELPDEIPMGWRMEAASYGVDIARLRGGAPDDPSPVRVLQALDVTIGTLRETVFPLVHAG
jgi:acetoin utilization protein AcuC